MTETSKYPTVGTFTGAMAEQLAANEYKDKGWGVGGDRPWCQDSPWKLLKQLDRNQAALRYELERGHPEEAKLRAVNVANYAMMAWDIIGQPPPRQVQVGELKLWRIFDGETHHYAAPDEAAALAAYRTDNGDADVWDGEPPEISPCCKDFYVTFVDEPGRPQVKASELMTQLEGEPGMICTSCH